MERNHSLFLSLWVGSAIYLRLNFQKYPIDEKGKPEKVFSPAAEPLHKEVLNPFSCYVI